MTESLGKSVLELEANLLPFEKNVRAAKGTANDMQHALDALAAVANLTESALNDVKMDRGQAAESKVTAESILSGVKGIGQEARQAARDLDDVKLDSANAAETTAAGDVIDRKLKAINRNANEARRSLESVRLAGLGAAGAGGSGGAGRNGVGVGPFGSGFGRIGVMGAAIGGGALLGPAAGPGALGLLAAIPTLASSGVGALGALALAFQGVGKAIGGDKKAFDDLGKSAQAFVLTVRSLDGWFDKLKETAGAAMFPGLTAGLKAALSPGTVAAITTAVTEFGRAIGAAGAAWGRYFGSAEFQSIFGPLMQAGARNLSLMSDAALHLFDAIGVLGRAAIPFTEWMVKGIDAGAQWAAAFMHAKEASGALGSALNEAQTSLRLVGALFASLLRAVGALGEALYPVSKVAVKDLTDGLSSLAGIIDRNKQTIRDIVSGALAALVTAVKTAAAVIRELWPVLQKVVDLLGGWKTTFEILIGMKIASLVSGWAVSFAKLAGAEALGGAELKSAGLLANLKSLANLRMAAIPIVLDVALVGAGAVALLKFMDWAANGLPGSPTPSADRPVGKNGYPPLSAWTTDEKKAFAAQNGPHTAEWYGKHPSAMDALIKGVLSGAATTHGPGSAHSGAGPGMGTVGGPGDFADESAALKNTLTALAKRYGAINLSSGYRSEAKQTALWDASVKAGHPGFMPNGNPIARPGSRGGAGSDHSRGTAADGTILYQGKWIPLSALPQSVLAAYGLSTVPGDVGHVMLTSGGAAGTPSPFGTPPPFTKNTGPKPPKPAMPTGANLLTQGLRDALQHAKDQAMTTQGATAERWLRAELSTLKKAQKDLDSQLDKGGSAKHVAAIKAEIRSIDGQIASVNKQITTNLHQQATAVKQAFTSQISSAKSNISSAMSTLKATLDAQFQQATQDYIDKTLGPKFFQGTDAHGKQLLTPKEQQLLDMQKADQRKSLDDSIRQAQEQLTSDQTTSGAAVQASSDAYNAAVKAREDALAAGKDAATLQELQTAINNARTELNDVTNRGVGPMQLKADQDALDAARRQLDEYNIAAAAADERAQADKDYADAVKQYQRDRSELERQMNLQLDLFGKGLADGTTKLSDLGGVVAEFGLSLTAGGGIVDDFVTLQGAVLSLVDVLIAEAQRLGGVGDNKDATAAALRAARLIIPEGAPEMIPGTNLSFAGFVAASLERNAIPKLDVGGKVMETGLAVVHQGETYSGVGASRDSGHAAQVASVGNELELGLMIGRMMQRANKNGIKFELV